MDVIYGFMDVILPFSWAGHTFMKNAFLAVFLITPLLGMLGTMVVANRMAFFADSLGHSAFTGIALGVMLGLFSPRISLMIFSAVFALFIILIRRKSGTSTDTTISVFSSAAVALGIMLMSAGGGFNKYSVFLIGDLLSITADDLLALSIVFVVVVALWILFFNPLLLLSVNEQLAAGRGIKPWLAESVFALLLAVVVALSIEWVGILLINSLLVLPAAGAANIAVGVRKWQLYSVVIAVFSGITGLILAYYFDMAAGASIVLTAAAIFFVTFALRPFVRL